MAEGKKILEEKILKDISYEVPKNWVWVRLGAVCKLVNGFAFRSTNYKDSGIPILKISNIQEFGIMIDDKTVYSNEEEALEKYIVGKGDLLIAMSGSTTGKTGIYNESSAAYLNQRVGNLKIIRKDLILEKFRDYLIAYKSKEILNFAYGEAQPNISISMIEDLIVPLPPLKEQQRIIERVESLFEKLNKAKELIEETRENFEKRKSASMYTLLDANGSEKIPLSKCIKFINDKKEPEDGDVYIGLENIKRASGIISYGIAKDVKSTKTKFKNGDVLYGRLRPYLNKHDVADKDGICSTDILVMRPVNGYDPRYINYMLDTLEFINYANANSSGINLPRVSSKVIGEYLIPKKDFEEQTEYVKIFDRMFQMEREIEEVTQLEGQIELIKKSILAKAFRGELGTTCAREERASL